MKKILISVLCCLVGGMVIAQEWVTFTKSTPESPIINLVQSNNQQVEFTAEVCGMFKQNIVQEGETFQRIEIPGAGKSMETGEPEIPYIRQLIAIPECDNVVLTVTITGQTSFTNYNIYPAPDFEEVQNPDGTVYLQEVFSINEAVYAQNSYLPGINAEIVSTGYLRDQKYAEVFLYPVQFNPVTKQLSVFTHYQVTLSFANPASAVNINTGIFNNVATHTMLNYISSGITASINDYVQGNGNVQWISLTDTAQACAIIADYLIICADPFFEPNNPNSEVLRIANHRATYNGFDVAILNANTIISDGLGFYYDVTTPQYKKEQRIRTCIRRIYEGAHAQHTYDGKLGYVLLIGDSEYGSNLGMPSSTDPEPGYSDPYSNPFISDYYFTCITQENNIIDEVGDLYVGRFCVDNNLQNGLIELHNIIHKTIFFESEYSFGEWRNNVSHTNGTAGFEDYYTAYYSFLGEQINGFNLNIVNWYASNQILEPTLNILNSGSVTMHYNGHGSINGWEDNLTIMPLELNLTNTNIFPFCTSTACQTGWFDHTTDCMGEALTTYSEDKGFVGFLGCSRSTWISYSTYIPIPPHNFRERIPYMIWHDLSHITGEFILEAKLNSSKSVPFSYNLFGDPALNIMAQGFEVTQSTTLSANTTISTSITVQSGNSLTVPANGQLYFENNGKLIIEEGAALNILSNCIIKGNSENNSIVIKGNLFLGSGTNLSSQNNEHWNGIHFDNLAKNYSIYNVVLENCYLSGESMQLNLSNCTFNNSGIKYQKGDLIISNSNFNNSKIEAKNGSKSSFIEIKSGCTIQNCESEPAIYIDSYYKYTIDDCTVSGNHGDAIGIYNSGSYRGINDIKNNIITNNGWENIGSGIELYRSYANIYGDQLIEGNKYGISCFDKSNVSIRGNSSANYIYETPMIVPKHKHG
jgi:hypothetical protein